MMSIRISFLSRNYFWIFGLLGSSLSTPLYSMEPAPVVHQKCQGLVNPENVVLLTKFIAALEDVQHPSILQIRKSWNMTKVRKKIAITDDEIEKAWAENHPQDENALPAHYLHRSVQRQLKMYRCIYEDAMVTLYNGDVDVDKLETGYIPGLFDILRQAFALVHDSIKSSKGEGEDLEKLRQMWVDALQRKGKLTPRAYKYYLIQLSLLIQNAQNPYFPYAVYDTDEREDSIISRTFISFIILGNPDPNIPARSRQIGMATFVDQYCNDKFPGYIAFFDVLSMPHPSLKEPSIRSKRDPHWGFENGTAKLFVHDLVHNAEQVKRPAFKNICKVYNEHKKRGQGNENNTKILERGLFILTHEAQIRWWSGKNIPDDEIIKIVKAKFMESVGVYGSQRPARGIKNSLDEYKEEYRDWENILRDGFDQDHKEFLPMIVYDIDSDNNPLKRPFPYAYDPADPTKVIVVTPELKDKTQNLKFLTKEEQMDFPYGITNDDEVHSQRDRLMRATLRDGYARFWDYFKALLDNPPLVIEDAPGEKIEAP